MNAGAAASRASALLFLHLDTQLPDGADAMILAALDGGVAWGRFDVTISGRHPLLPIVSTSMNLRSRLTGIATGDQAIFVRAEAFAAAGGFPAWPLMEDLGLSRALKRLTPPLCLRERATTSGRRWDANGLARTVALMWWLRARHALGADCTVRTRRILHHHRHAKSLRQIGSDEPRKQVAGAARRIRNDDGNLPRQVGCVSERGCCA